MDSNLHDKEIRRYKSLTNYVKDFMSNKYTKNEPINDIIHNQSMKLYYALIPSGDRKFYSYEFNYITKKLNISPEVLLRYWNVNNTKESNYFNSLTNDHVNIFNYNGIIYIGLESERIRYEEDKILGINYVEFLIQQGYYQ